MATGERVLISVRPEDVEVGPAGTPRGDNQFEGRVATAVYMGNYVDYQVEAEGLRIRVQAKPSTLYREGDRVAVAFPPAACVCIPGGSDVQ